MHKKNLTLILASLSFVILGFSSHSYAQTPKKSIFVELGGNNLFYSINYERFFKTNYSARVGLGASWWNNEYVYTDRSILVCIPVMINKFFGNPNSNHKFETGIGLLFSNARYKYSDTKQWDNNFRISATATLGYRYIPQTRGLTFKVALTPIFNQDKLTPMIGFAMGYAE